MFRKVFQSIKTKISEYKKNNSLPGNYKLFEYYTDTDHELVNVKEDQLIAKKLFWDIRLTEDGKCKNDSNLDIPLIADLAPGSWSRSRNFVTLLHPGDFRKNVEFQFAFEKGNLKLLKKDITGKIIVFAFFKRLP